MAMPPFLVISRRDVADAQDVEVAVLAREAELAGQVLAHHGRRRAGSPAGRRAPAA